MITLFQKSVYDVLRKIPAGKVLTYKQIAQKINIPRAARAVGNALNKNYDPQIPCHKVDWVVKTGKVDKLDGFGNMIF